MSGDGSSGGRSVSGNDVDDSGRKSGLADQVGDVQAGQRSLFGQLKF